MYIDNICLPSFTYLDNTRADSALKRIQVFSKRQKGWNFGSGEPSTKEIIENSLLVAQRLIYSTSKIEDRAYLSDDGKITVVGYFEGWECEIACSTNNNFELIIVKDNEEKFDKFYNKIDDLFQELKKWENQWNSAKILPAYRFSELSTLSFMTLRLGDFEASALQNPPQIKEYQSSAMTALLPRADLLSRMSKTIMQPCMVNQ